MQTTTVVAALVTGVVFAVGGYVLGTKSGKVTPLTHKPTGKSCGSGDCNVTIGFDCVDPTHPTNTTCVPYADPDVVVMRTGHKIKFKIDSTHNDFKFDSADGIKFTSSNVQTGWLPCTPQGGSGKDYSCDNNIPTGTDPDAYKYAIHIIGFSIVDPFMVNY